MEELCGPGSNSALFCAGLVVRHLFSLGLRFFFCTMG